MNLKEHRKRKGMKAVEVARFLGVSRSRYGHIENKIYKPTIPQAKALGKLLGFDWWLLFEDEEEE